MAQAIPRVENILQPTQMDVAAPRAPWDGFVARGSGAAGGVCDGRASAALLPSGWQWACGALPQFWGRASCQILL